MEYKCSSQYLAVLEEATVYRLYYSALLTQALKLSNIVQKSL